MLPSWVDVENLKYEHKPIVIAMWSYIILHLTLSVILWRLFTQLISTENKPVYVELFAKDYGNLKSCNPVDIFIFSWPFLLLRKVVILAVFYLFWFPFQSLTKFSSISSTFQIRYYYYVPFYHFVFCVITDLFFSTLFRDKLNNIGILCLAKKVQLPSVFVVASEYIRHRLPLRAKFKLKIFNSRLYYSVSFHHKQVKRQCLLYYLLLFDVSGQK